VFFWALPLKSEVAGCVDKFPSLMTYLVMAGYILGRVRSFY
jgi:hypothetical protein